MKVILVKKVDNLGNPGDEVEVKPGYFRNYLQPKLLAARASEVIAKNILAEKEKQQKMTQANIENLQTKAAQFAGKTLTINAKVNQNGNLYGKINSSQVAQKLGLKKDQIQIPIIKKAGEYQGKIKLAPGILENIKIIVRKVT